MKSIIVAFIILFNNHEKYDNWESYALTLSDQGSRSIGLYTIPSYYTIPVRCYDVHKNLGYLRDEVIDTECCKAQLIPPYLEYDTL